MKVRCLTENRQFPRVKRPVPEAEKGLEKAMAMRDGASSDFLRSSVDSDRTEGNPNESKDDGSLAGYDDDDFEEYQEDDNS